MSRGIKRLVALLVAPITIPLGAFQPPPLVMPPLAQPVPARIAIAEGAFEPTWDSLQRYQCPEWFRDAKLGFWGILGPQSQAGDDSWYARKMYIEGGAPYRFHVEQYGHPSQFGYKDLAAQWKADRFDPDRLIELYKKAGAKYFVALGPFHDNWDNWNSKYHRWNSVNVGPKKDIVGLWAAAAKKQGLRFGVSEHLERSYSWFNTNKGSDKQGKYAGVPYDGNDPKYADLYFPPHEDSNIAYPKNPPEWWTREWFWRIRDLVDSYQPDLLYSDGAVPFDAIGRSLMAHFYNTNAARHGGKLEAVYNIKDMNHRAGHDHGEYVAGIAVQDVERGGLPEISPLPWQTDTCIGDWFYKVGYKYKSAKEVIAFLCDVVSKNGNLLLNIPIKYDGTIDSDEVAVLSGMSDWMAVNGEAIFGTRPWLVFGEGPNNIKPKGGSHYTESVFAQMTARDIRFTTKGGTLYAIALGWPDDGKLRIRSLAISSGKIENVGLLGHAGKLEWVQTKDELLVTLPDSILRLDAMVLKISGMNLRPSMFTQ
jgi:alpha-L-fucosidase